MSRVFLFFLCISLAFSKEFLRISLNKPSNHHFFTMKPLSFKNHFLSLHRLRISGNAEVRPLNVERGSAELKRITHL